MIVEVAMPNMGLTLAEATLLRWLKAPGDPVRKGEPLFEIETDKAVQEIESEVDGVLVAQTAREGEVVALGAAVGTIDLAPQPPEAGSRLARSSLVPTGEGGGDTDPSPVCGR